MSNDANKLRQKQEIRKYLVFAGMFLLFLGAMWFIFAPSEEDKQKEEKNAVDLIFQQILKIERCVDFHQKANAVNKLMRMIDTHQLHISDEIRTCIENLGNYYLARINGSIDEDLVYENSVKNKLKKAYYGL